MATKSSRCLIAAIVRYLFFSLWAITAFFPIYWMVFPSFKPDIQWFAWPPVYFPDPPTLTNYMNVWLGSEQYDQSQYAISSQKPLVSLWNSTAIALSSTFLSVTFGSVLPYAFSRHRIISNARMFQLILLCLT